MAVQQGYGKMAGANSLVFAYDTTDTTNSFKGAPTTNLLSPDAQDPTTWGQRPLADKTLLEETYKGLPVYRLQDQDGVDPSVYVDNYQQVQSFTGLTQGDIYVFSFYFRVITHNNIANTIANNCAWVWYAGTTDSIFWNNYELNVWHKAELQCAVGATYDYLIPRIDYDNSIVDICGLQFEKRASATPYTPSSRSNEQSIIDLTGNHTVDVSTIDFTNGFELDGTNDHMTFNLTKTPNMSFEAIVNYPTSTAVPSSEMLFNAGNSGSGPDVYFTSGKICWNIWDGANNPFATIPRSWSNGKNHHVVIVNDQTNNITKCYYDGALLGTATYRQCTADNMSIGGNGTGYNYRGNIPVFKVYNEALTEAQVQANFKVYRKRFEGLDYYIDDTTDGGGWTRFWWYTGVGWPGHETEALGHPFGTFDSSSHYGFQRLPEGLAKEQVELLAKDGDGNILKWDFASSSVIAQHMWDSFTVGTQGSWRQDGDPFNPVVIAGNKPNPDQDAWKYRDSEGVVSFLLDDDGCDCQSTLNAGHAMCGGGWSQTYAQPDGAYLRYGVDTLYDGGCRGPVPERTLELFYRLK